MNAGKTPAHIIKFVTSIVSAYKQPEELLPDPQELLAGNTAQEPSVSLDFSPGQFDSIRLGPPIEMATIPLKKPFIMAVADVVYTDTTRRVYHTRLCVYVDNLQAGRILYCPYSNSNIMK